MAKGLVTTGTDGATIETDRNLIDSSLERLFFTSMREIPGMLDVGSRIPDFLYDPMDESTAVAILEEVKFLVNAYEPRVKLREAKVSLINNGVGDEGIIIDITYSINADSTEEIKSSFGLIQ